MIAQQKALVGREVWEHRAIWLTPAVIALLISLMAVTGQVVVSAFGDAVDVAILGASSVGERERSAAISILMIAISSVFAIAMWVLMIFYSLDALFAERKDRSILFWRSLPTSDAATVLSKLLTALVVIPLATFAGILLTHLVVLAISSVWIELRGGDSGLLVWAAAPFVDNWVATFVTILALPLWLSPFVGWFLLVSAVAKRSPFLLAVLPIFILPMLERMFLGSAWLAEALFARYWQLPLFRGLDTRDLLFYEGEGATLAEGAPVSLLPLLDLPGFLASPGLWAGLLVCALFTAGAIFVRRYRDDS